MLCVVYVSPKGQVGEEGDGQEDGRDSTANKCDKGEDGGLQTAGHRLSEEVLYQSYKIILEPLFAPNFTKTIEQLEK